MDKNVCNRLKSERISKNITQKAVALVTDVSEKTVGRWETSIAIPSDKLTLLSDLGLDVLYIVTGQRGNAKLVSTIDTYSDEEKSLIDMFRKMGDSQKELFLSTAQVFANQ